MKLGKESWKESSRVYNDKFRSNGLERSELDKQW